MYIYICRYMCVYIQVCMYTYVYVCIYASNVAQAAMVISRTVTVTLPKSGKTAKQTDSVQQPNRKVTINL